MFATFLNDGWDCWSRSNHDGQIYRVADIGKTFVRPLALDRLALRVDWIDPAAKSSSEQVSKDHLADRVLTLTSTKYGNAVYRKRENANASLECVPNEKPNPKIASTFRISRAHLLGSNRE